MSNFYLVYCKIQTDLAFEFGSYENLYMSILDNTGMLKFNKMLDTLVYPFTNYTLPEEVTIESQVHLRSLLTIVEISECTYIEMKPILSKLRLFDVCTFIRGAVCEK